MEREDEDPLELLLSPADLDDEPPEWCFGLGFDMGALYARLEHGFPFRMLIHGRNVERAKLLLDNRLRPYEITDVVKAIYGCGHSLDFTVFEVSGADDGP